MFSLKTTCVLSTISLLSACGGSSTVTPTNITNVAPVAIVTATNGLAIVGLKEVVLNGSGSLDSDGVITIYQWSQTAGPAVTLDNDNESSLHFTPGNISDTLTFALSVTDNAGASHSTEISLDVQQYFKQLDAGNSHYCAIVAEVQGDDIYCWGTGNYDLMQTPAVSNPISIVSGGNNSCVIDDNGVQCWGSNINGITSVPSLVNTQKVVIGGRHACALDDNGVHCWGNDVDGAVSVPPLSNPVNITVGWDNTCVLDDNGMQCWGGNTAGQSDVPNLQGVSALFDSNSRSHCALDDGGLVCWGRNGAGEAPSREQLTSFNNVTEMVIGWGYSCIMFNNDSGDQNVACIGEEKGFDGVSKTGVMTEIPALVNPRQLTTINDGACVLDDTGVVCWGNYFKDQTAPPVFSQINQMTSGYYHSCALGSVDNVENTLHCWGANVMDMTSVPTLTNPVYIATNDRRSCAIDDNGAHCWGEAFNPQFPQLHTQAIVLPENWHNVSAIEPGLNSICAIVDGIVQCWSKDAEYGEAIAPQLDNTIAITAADTFNCAIADSGVSCWGSIFGNPFDVATPILNNPLSLSAQDSHACAIADNQVHCWGSGTDERLTAPQLVNPSKVVAGPQHSCAIDDEGVTCWGNNYYGESKVPQLSNPTDITLGFRYTCASDDTGLVCWGWNGYGGTPVPLKPE